MSQTIWEIHAERQRRHEQLQRINTWILEHKRLADLLSVAFAVAVFSLAMLIEKALELLGRAFAH